MGVAGLVGAGVFGWKAKQAWDERNAACRGGCGPAAAAAGDSAETFAWVANASLGIGLLAAGIGTYVLWSAPRASSVTVGVAASDDAALLSASGAL